MKNVSFHKSIIVLMTYMAFLTACGAGSGDGLDQNGDPLEDDNSIPLADNFASIQVNIFTLSCALSGCHSGAAPPEGLLLSDTNSYANLVDIDSNQNPGLKRIQPGDADNSYLIQKVEGTASVGLRMLRNRPALTNSQIQALRSWVDKGALGPTLSSIQQNIFTPICTQCHAGPTPPANLNLEQGQSFNNLVGVPRSFDTEFRVVAGDANNSFIIDKLEGNNLGGSRGDRMPLGGPFLDQNTINVIRNWIDDGAKNS